MPTDATKLTPGLPYPMATLLGKMIDGASNASLGVSAGWSKADILCNGGFNPTLAIELARQITAGSGHIHHLMSIGVNGELAKAIKAAIG